jgi:hypothetical protein
VILGYLSMAIVVFICLTAAYLAMGADRAFKPGLYEVTASWLMVMFIVSIGAALVGGKICALIAKNSKAVMALAGLVLVLGLLSAAPSLAAPSGEVKARTGDVPNMEAMMNAKQPAWVALLMPLIGVVGVLISGRVKAAAPAA